MGYNILVFNWRDIKNPNAGGAEVNFQEIFKRLVRRGHRVTLVSSRHERSFPEEEWIEGIRILRRGNRHTFNYTVPLVYKREFQNAPIDIVVDDLNKIPFYTPLYVRHPLFVMVHHLHGKSIYGDTLLPAALYVHFMERVISLFYKGIQFVAVSESTRSELIRMGLRPQDIQIIHNGVDHDSYTPDSSARSIEPLIACVTRLKKYKGAHILLRAMESVKKEIPEARLVITGRGDYEPRLRTLAKKLHLNGCVEFSGFVTTEQKVDLYRRAHVVVNPSAKEGWGLTVIEANACGTPVIAAEAPGLKESVLHEETGLLYPHADFKALSKAIVLLLKDRETRERLATRSILWAKEFTWEKATQEIEALMDRVISGQTKKRKSP